MRSYNSYIAGTDQQSESWVYSIRASAVLNDFVASVKLKRGLEKGLRDDGAQQPDVVARCSISTQEQLDAALVQAKAATAQWAAFPLEKRLELARRFHLEVKKRQQEFIDVLIAEGHPRKLAEWEVAGILQCSSYESLELWERQLHEERKIGPRRLLLVRKPDGVVVLSPPQNAAASNSVGGLAVLVAGNCLVVKAPRSCAYGVMYVWRDIVAPILEDLGAPPGVLSIVCGNSGNILQQWLDSPLVNDIFYFGSSERGIQLGIDAVSRGKKPILELAGKDGCVVWKDADLGKAAEMLTECFFGSGQICMVPKYAILHPDIAEPLIALLLQKVAGIRPGYPEDSNALLSPVLRTDEYFRYLQEATEAGARLLTGGHRVELDGQPSQTGPFIAPTILRIDSLTKARSMSSVSEETFFPLLPLVIPEVDHADLLDEVIQFINDNQYGLRNSFWTSSESVISQVVSKVNNGGLLKINDSHIGFTPWLATHGGTGLTGGPFGELNYPLLRSSHLQGISIAENVQPSQAVFESTSFSEEKHSKVALDDFARVI
ncbi:aldehyde dehydrogenase [Rheinheimera sp. 4Y26]|uniref:aldehyde dehydrogenase family protein n=1 Tax=Rheinheimera sp. 4Y26 TaxID=2977811 RepID=UPI0021B0AC89|nr:aldehyde dehydrogenase family protein [Rheinheimera sp. 4Y26]MCT6700354.1 aldehyde dehydrogenase family protein [Rheinheimera sp. 4Y26]